MYHLHLARNLRSVAFVLVAAALVTACAVLWWANRTGLPDSWRTVIEREISKKGVHVNIGRLSYLPLRGVIASKVRVFSDPTCRHEISRLESILLNFDMPKLACGIVDIARIELKDAQLTLPIIPLSRWSNGARWSKVVVSGESGAQHIHPPVLHDSTTPIFLVGAVGKTGGRNGAGKDVDEMTPT